MPCLVRLQAFSWHLITAATATGIFTLAHQTTSVIGGTALLSATIDLEAVTEGVARAAGTTPTLSTTSANRDIPRGSFITGEFDGNAAGDLVDESWFCALVEILDHVQALPAND